MNLIGTESQHLLIKRGDTLRLNFGFNTDDNTPLDLTDCTARLHVRIIPSDILIIDATTENELLTIEPNTGTVKLLVPAEEMTYAPIGRHKFDLEITFPDGSVLSSATNILEVVRDITAHNEQAIIPNHSGAYNPHGLSGYSGLPGFSGYSGVSGFSGRSGYSSHSGFSGLSGYSGHFGTDGTSGYSGIDGLSGTDGISGYSGYSGYSGLSGFSGYSGLSGFSGYSGYSGFEGPTAISTDIGQLAILGTDGLILVDASHITPEVIGALSNSTDLASLSSGQATVDQILVADGLGGVNWKTIGPNERHSIYAQPYYYFGTAPPGSQDNEAVWTITRLNFIDGLTLATATMVSWSDYLTAIYI